MFGSLDNPSTPHASPPRSRADREIRQASALLWLPFEITPKSNMEMHGLGPSFGIPMPESVLVFNPVTHPFLRGIVASAQQIPLEVNLNCHFLLLNIRLNRG